MGYKGVDWIKLALDTVYFVNIIKNINVFKNKMHAITINHYKDPELWMSFHCLLHACVPPLLSILQVSMCIKVKFLWLGSKVFQTATNPVSLSKGSERVWYEQQSCRINKRSVKVYSISTDFHLLHINYHSSAVTKLFLEV
jgi:hypothetical protein